MGTQTPSTATASANQPKPTVDVADLTARVKEMYTAVAQRPQERLHFEIGRGIAERLGYPAEELDRIPAAATESFAGVGYFFDLADPRPGEHVLDLGSGSGMDAFFAALRVGGTGRVTGIDMTEEQRNKAERWRVEAGFDQVEFLLGRIEELPLADETVDVVISNGVINLAPDKRVVFGEATRVLRPGGRLVISDIVTEAALAEDVKSNAELWASCIGGAAQQDDYVDAINGAGLSVEVVRANNYDGFLSDQARGASVTFGVKSVSILARKPE